MAPDLIDDVLAEMNRTGKSNTITTKRPKLEVGENATSPNTISIPIFPRYPTNPGRPMMSSDLPQRPFTSARRYYTGGPVPAPGTPQDRFAATLGHSNSHFVPTPSMGMIYPNPSFPRSPAVDMRMTGWSGTNYAPSQPIMQNIPNYNSPTGPAANTRMESNNNNGSGGRGPTLPPPFSPATQWLSYECQRRHFNPIFKLKESCTETGEPRYRCDVILRNIVVHSSTDFDNAVDARAHVAEKALKKVRHAWPVAGPSSMHACISTSTTNKPKVKNEETPQPAPMAPSSIDMSDPVQARAYVEGFRMGQLSSHEDTATHGLSSPGFKQPETQARTRSRSPTVHRDSSHSIGGGRHRHRSPLRGSSKTKSEFSSPPRHHDGRHGLSTAALAQALITLAHKPSYDLVEFVFQPICPHKLAIILSHDEMMGHGAGFVAQVVTEHPQNTFIVDFECIPSADGPLPLQVAIFDASEQQIVPATVIDHEMTIGDLRNKISLSKFHQARGMFSPAAMIQKFYPGRNIGPLKACITWSSHSIDIRCLNYILETAGAEDLLVPEWKFKDQPLGWYSTVRRQKKLDARTLSLRLGRLYGAFFPEDRKLTLEAHDAGADVTMTIRLVKAYLLTAFGMPLPGKIDSHFSSADTGAKGWELDAKKLLELLEEATSGIASSEVVDDDENSQSNIDELLNENEKILGDIPGDESVEKLSIKLEEENLFEDHLAQNAEFLAEFLRQNRNFLGEDDTDLFVADTHAMNTIEDSTSGDNKGLGEPTTPATKITKRKEGRKDHGGGGHQGHQD
ncbi:hypothetical protein VP1G_09823 [Cytospora mali]|uniref:Uncharacterized protein n=1 Tax=Cytospora mali TaxID=578113 RepID=A0A194VFP3_CYTMA|nr:hypothetical protein VP1G_09823 [Valsa mali var. pyri (nom. inval.)]